MGMSRSESRRLAIAQAKKNEEELQEFRKEQIGRRGQLVAAEEKAAARGPGTKKKAMNSLIFGGPVGINGGVGLGVMGVSAGGKGTPPRGATPVASSGLNDAMKKSHHKKKPPRESDENSATTGAQKRKHPHQYPFPGLVGVDGCRYAASSGAGRQIMPAAKGPGDHDEEELVQNDGVTGDETRYCYCNQVSYGEMVACDRDGCTKEWSAPSDIITPYLFIVSVWMLIA
jgi:hypothetical protein